ncbi:hypothetical protein ACJRO7_013908 [Eucalyptus globulus]|uniref:Uncharacterized protein n=1 Tax=Eucalyptus globulus TaxID=34317 RepID=A0ABD3KZD3_EUCGL
MRRSSLLSVWVVGQKACAGIIPSGSERLGVKLRLRLGGLGSSAQHPLPLVAIGGFLAHHLWSSVVEAPEQGQAPILFAGGSSEQRPTGRPMDEMRVE